MTVIIDPEPTTDIAPERPKTRFIPVNDWPKYHPWPTEKGLRRMVDDEMTNGFHVVVKRVRRRVLIDEAAFFRWVDEEDAKNRKAG